MCASLDVAQSPDLTTDPDLLLLQFTPAQIAQLTTVEMDYSLNDWGQRVEALRRTVGSPQAARMSRCQSHWKRLRDAHGHEWSVHTSLCEFRIICLNCRQVIATRHYREYERVEQLIPADGDFLHFTFSPLPDESLLALADRVGKFFQRRLPRRPAQGQVFLQSRQFRVVYAGQLTPAQLSLILGVFPDMTYSQHPRAQFRDQLSLLVKGDFPTDPQALATLERDWKGKKLFRPWGLTKQQKQEIGILEQEAERETTSVITESPNTDVNHSSYSEFPDNSHLCPHNHSDGSTCGQPAIRKLPKCPHCGAHATHETKWYERGVRLPSGEMEWKELPKPLQ